MIDRLERAQVLAEALPYIQRFRGATFVIKYGGHAMLSPELRANFAQDAVLLQSLGIKPVIVHGGGPQINDLIARLGLSSSFVRGMRVTDAATMDAVEMVLQKINKELVALIWAQGGRAIGLSGKDGNLLAARKMYLQDKDKNKNGRSKPLDIGLVGEVAAINLAALEALEPAGFIPIIAPVGAGADGLTYNINADVAAGALAGALHAQKLMLLTDVEGVKDKSGTLLNTIDSARANRMIASGAISEGMIPKVECCLAALEAGAAAAHIVDGRVPHSVLLEVFTNSGIGTEVVRAAPSAARNGRRPSA